MVRTAFLVVVSMMVVSIAGCGATPGITPRQEPSGSGPATIIIRNASNKSIYYVYMSPVRESSWSEDMMGSNVIARGQTFELADLAPGAFDIRVADASSNHRDFVDQRIEPGGQYFLDVDSEGWVRP